MIKRDDTRTPPPESVIPRFLSPAFLRYLDEVAGKVIQDTGHGHVGFDLIEKKPKNTTYTVSGRAGHQF